MKISLITTLLLASTVSFMSFANDKACGQITVKSITKESQSVYPAYIYKVDGKNVMGQRHTINLTVGRHEVELKEMIDDPTVRRFRQLNGTSDAKVLTIDVVENKKYWLASKLNRSAKSDVRTGKHWTPVIWQEYSQPCELNWFEI